MNLIGSQLHYHCRFDVTPATDEPDSRSRLLHEVRRWVIGAIKRHAGVEGIPTSVQGRWFFVGGQWRLPRYPRVTIETAALATAAAEGPDGPGTGAWAMRFEHPCAEERFRQWAVDVAVWPLRADQPTMGFSLTTTNWMLPEYIGKEPASPTPTAPGIVKALLRSKTWNVSAGAVPLADTPRRIDVGDGKEFAALLTSDQRSCPVVYASFDPAAGRPLLDCDNLASVLAGVAVVAAAAAPDLDEELPWLLPADLCCRRGTVRVYQPQLDATSERDFRRHRYFSSQLIADLGEREVTAMIVRGVARRFLRWDDAAPTSIDDVRRLARQSRLTELRDEAGGMPTKEWVEALEDVNKQVETEARELRGRLARLESQLAEFGQDRQEHVELLGRAEKQRDDANRRADEAHARARAATERFEAIGEFATLPATLVEVVDRVAALHPSRLVIADEARDSAAQSKFEDLPEAWRCIWAIATVLHDLYLTDNLPPSRVAEEFRARTGFDIALTESSQTQKDKKLMALRRVVVNGVQYDVAAHVGIGNRDPAMLRVHYAVDRDRRRLVVGHCGGHLTTAGTRRRGQ